ncbi:hypothetical protein G1L11_12520 [Tenacibaculum finnmarkense]|uniref:hypothetical protein n=1 Tax=Tenacibaculum finnmarkense TaxID=2781243 RepID=UPI001EFA8D58|nr:hypothetical protein [Tenacibaculum finnmarkense]MCG8857654.1 hypothetical protein [Tenacibaculum finnmarkense]
MDIKEYKNKAVSEIGSPFLKPLGWFLILSFITTISFPLIWLWEDITLALKISLTGLFLMIVLGALYRLIENLISKQVDVEFEKNPPSDLELGKSNFSRKLDKMMAKHKS